MYFNDAHRHRLWLIFLLSAIFALCASSAYPQSYDLEVLVGDTTASPGEQNAVIPIYMSNLADTVAMFQMFLILNRQDIMEFTGEFDTSNTLCSGWEIIWSDLVGGTGYVMRIVAQADYFWQPYTPGIGYPQFGETPLIKVLANVYDIPDSMTDRTVNIFMQHENAEQFGFYDQNGDIICATLDTVYDTSWFECLAWIDDICLFWEEVAEGPVDSVDSFWCCDTTVALMLDTAKVNVLNGTLRVLPSDCMSRGDANNDESRNLLDITFLISYLYKSGSAPLYPEHADADGNAIINLLDITYLIKYLYKGGPAPVCP